MGSRLGVLVKSEDGWETYYDHWAAQSIGLDIAIDGVEATLERVRSMMPMEVNTPQEWEGATWIEGTLLIDTTKKIVVWAEESEYLYLPRLINWLVEQTWPGWTAVWSAEATRGTLRAAGADPTPIYRDLNFNLRVYERTPDLYPWEEWHGTDPITVKLQDGELVTWRAYGFMDDLVHLGPEGVRKLAVEVSSRMPVESAAWAETMEDDLPTSGVFVDFLSSTFSWWSLSDENIYPEEFEPLWPGWAFDAHGDDYRWHEELTGEEYRIWEGDVAECREWFSKAFEEGRRPNPFVRMAEALADYGETVQPLGTVLEFKPAQRRGVATAFDQYFDSLVGMRLPPARFIDRHGVIKPPIV
ncbi:hypothetical protein [Schaalia sp. ZJ1691]|uniref:hypothetical protein n=1 Tax=Schaalia sp. ZJ1691 TaxID=2709404 RepID=UPI0013EB5B6D|nr:hypothetical protein [Schaalia sp. ZJ1691]